ncbi:MAG: peptidase M16 [Nitrospirae bacterium CG18_big_fil_WC_8_21_14_2_50_70_55]|nr:insulinase family protein [Deltaproteobacteria bacterium]NCP96379.1 insulinase family protein [Deltaproteobacteria bacterium]NCS72946.1 insulinase family protein [Deltaproteobacteria bacterium]PIQ03052.1 MAG: peptidase M16 [Nitrospirae bacterium CG18_big_fil_WC_8_21_14_2_50_70_55]PJB94658.1 MAG: peptidase M16 [Nitrospirae bacterium CG_4_9_14_0_8_um_filter_70_14]
MKHRVFLLATALVAVAACTARWPHLATPPTPSAPAATQAAPLPTRQPLATGATLLTLSRPHLPVAAVEIDLAAGAARDPADRQGLASLTADLLDEGSAHHTGQELAAALESMGAELAITADHDAVHLSLRVLKQDLPAALDLVAELLRTPAFRDADVARLKEETRAALIAGEQEPNTIAGRAYNTAAYGDHPYGHPANGTVESVARVTAGDCRDFHRRYYHPATMVISMVGAIDADEAARLWNDRLAGWPAAPAPLPPLGEPPATQPQRVVLNRPFTQTTLILGAQGVRRDAPDFFATLVMNHILGGGGFGSRLTTELRERRGLVYSIASWFSLPMERGLFTIQLATQNGSAAEAEAAVRAEVRRLHDDGPSEAEVADAKAYLTGSFPLRLDSSAKLASYLLFMEHHSLGLDYLRRFPELVSAVTRDQVAAAARAHLDPDGLIVVAVGQPPEAR